MIDPIEFFEWYVLYNLPIIKVEFDFTNNTLRLELWDYEIREDQDTTLQLNFNGLFRYTFDYPADRFLFSMRGIYRATIKKIEENGYELELLIDMKRIEDGIEFTVGKMLIGFADLEVIGGLSREAMEYKWKVEEE